MCHLYSLTKGQQAIREAFKVMTDRTGNLPPMPDTFPDQMTPVVPCGAGNRELVMLGWGFSGPPWVPCNRPVTNVRNVGSPCWGAWRQPE